MKPCVALVLPRLRQYFPENQLGASLKLNDKRLKGAQVLGYFPENQLGASLKRVMVVVPFCRS